MKNEPKIDYQKLCEIMMWEQYEGESYEDTFLRKEIKAHEVPPQLLIDVVHADGLEGWAKLNTFKSLTDLTNQIIRVFKFSIVNPINSNKRMQELFPPIYNFCTYATRMDRNGRIKSEAIKIAESAWWGEIAQQQLKEKTDKLFDSEPCPKKYKEIAARVQEVWGFTDNEIEAFRYFVCQTRHENHNPSMNKSLFLWSGSKQTGKTTVARALAAVLNGETSLDGSGKFESTFNKEMQINDHDLPLAVQYNCVILDEAMPKDSSKSYGRVKSMLTSNSCSYNQKYGRIIPMKAKRFYIYTSNDDITDFIQDTSERRFIQILMNKMPKQISFDEIYDIWKTFAQNCTPEPDWQEWYNTFEDIDGLQKKDIDYFKNEILNNPFILNTIKNLNGYSLTLKSFEDLLVRGKTTRDERKNLSLALESLIGKSKGYRWSKIQAIEMLEEKIEEQMIDLGYSDEDKEGVEKLPF